MLGDELLRSRKCFPDYEAYLHLETILDMLLSLRRWRDAFAERVEEAKAAHNDGSYVEACERGTYAAVGYCHTAVAALAPMFEGMFAHEFTVLARLYEGKTPPSPTGHRRSNCSPEVFWNPKQYVNDDGEVHPKENVQQGSVQILKSLGLLDRFPKNFVRVTDALFTYRNQSLHNGYEWPKEKRAKFERLIAERRWSDWFDWTKSSYGSEAPEPWLAYMTDEFIRECFNIAGQSVVAFEAIRAEQFEKLPRDPAPPWLVEFWKKHGAVADQLPDIPVFPPVQWPAER